MLLKDKEVSRVHLLFKNCLFPYDTTKSLKNEDGPMYQSNLPTTVFKQMMFYVAIAYTLYGL